MPPSDFTGERFWGSIEDIDEYERSLPRPPAVGEIIQG
jgi:hypothetical protein